MAIRISGRRSFVLPARVAPGIAQDIDPAIYRPALTWSAQYDTQANMMASYSGPDQDVKLSNTGTLTLVADPLNPTRTRKFMQTDMPNGTSTTNGVTANPRMQIEDPRLILDGDEFWTAQTYIFPTAWPVVGTTDGYIQVFQMYGAPFGGGATITLTFRADGPYDTPDVLRWGFNRDNANIASNLAWKWATQRNKYVDIAMRIRADRKDPRTDDAAGVFYPGLGSVEIWLNTGTGWTQQTLIGGVTRLECVTIGEVNTTGPNSNEVQLYRRLDAFPGTLTHYISGHKRGPSLASVDPHSYDNTWL